MNGTATARILAAALALALLASPALAQDQPEKQWVWLNKQGVWGFGYQLQDGPHRGLWRIDPDSKTSPDDAIPTTDPYGFAAILNAQRASAGLPPLAYDHNLSAWAAQNNAEQSARGLGHFINPNCFQNSAWNTPDAPSTADEWMNSPPHRANMLSPSATKFGIAYGPGPYWTLNAQ